MDTVQKIIEATDIVCSNCLEVSPDIEDNSICETCSVRKLYEYYWTVRVKLEKIMRTKDIGYREREIYNADHVLRRGTWNHEHKVIHVISKQGDYDGYHASFSVDLVTGRICG